MYWIEAWAQITGTTVVFPPLSNVENMIYLLSRLDLFLSRRTPLIDTLVMCVM